MAEHDDYSASADTASEHSSDAASLHQDHDLGTEPLADAPAARTPGQRVISWVRKHWILTLILLVVLGVGSLVAYVFALQDQLTSNQDPTAASTENISRQLPRANTTDAVAPKPTESLDQKAQAERNIMPTQAGFSADSLNAHNATAVVTNPPPASVMPIDTAGQAQAARQKELARKQRINRASLAREAHRRNVDTVAVTERNPHTGAYESRTKIVQRPAPRAGRPSRDAKLPLYAPDGVPYEDNEEVNRMLSAAPPQAREVYEQMTGHRYRPVQQRPTTDQIKGVLAATPGMDGFFTVKLRKADGTAADEKPVDVFFKCQINGAQRVVSGSVVALRLTEDAVLDGRTFPKNLVFAGIAQVGSNNVNIQIERLGPARVACQLYDYNYMPGIMIDPGKRMPLDPGAQQFQNSLRTSTTSELTSAIDRSASAANSLGGISAKIGSSLITRIPRKAPKLREILLPDGYPVLLTSGNRNNAPAAAETSSSTTNGTPLPYLLNR
jgi:hypothetical protein